MSNEDPFDTATLFTWDEDGETIDFTSYGDAIGDYVDQHDLKEIYEGVRTVTIYAYVRATVTEESRSNRASYALAHLLELLDDVYRVGDCDGTQATPQMRAAAKEFVDKVLETYEVFNCLELASRTFDVIEWLTAHEPERLKELTDGVS